MHAFKRLTCTLHNYVESLLTWIETKQKTKHVELPYNALQTSFWYKMIIQFEPWPLRCWCSASQRSGFESLFRPEVFSSAKMIKVMLSNPHLKSMEISCIIIVYQHIYGLIIDPHNNLLPVGLKAQPVEHCTGIVEVRVWIPIQTFLAAAQVVLKT